MSLRAVRNAAQAGNHLAGGRAVHRATAMTTASERTIQLPAQTVVVRRVCRLSRHQESPCTAMIAIHDTAQVATSPHQQR